MKHYPILISYAELEHCGQDGLLVQGLQVALNGVSGSQVEAEPNVYVQTTELCKHLLGF